MDCLLLGGNARWNSIPSPNLIQSIPQVLYGVEVNLMARASTSLSVRTENFQHVVAGRSINGRVWCVCPGSSSHLALPCIHGWSDNMWIHIRSHLVLWTYLQRQIVTDSLHHCLATAMMQSISWSLWHKSPKMFNPRCCTGVVTQGTIRPLIIIFPVSLVKPYPYSMHISSTGTYHVPLLAPLDINATVSISYNWFVIRFWISLYFLVLQEIGFCPSIHQHFHTLCNSRSYSFVGEKKTPHILFRVVLHFQCTSLTHNPVCCPCDLTHYQNIINRFI